MRVALLAAGTSIHGVRWTNALVERGVGIDFLTMHPPLSAGGDALDPRATQHRLSAWRADAAGRERLLKLGGACAGDLINLTPDAAKLRDRTRAMSHPRSTTVYFSPGAAGDLNKLVQIVGGSVSCLARGGRQLMPLSASSK